jgi:hydrogenase maturation protease
LNDKIIILGIGNILLGDEGIGVHVVSFLRSQELPSNVEVIDGGTATFNLLPMISGVSKLIVVDAVKGKGEPGSIYRFTPDDIKAEKKIATSLHQIGLLNVLEMADKIGEKPKSTVIIGVEPQNMEWGLEPSTEIKKKIPKIIDLVLKEIYA